MKSKDLITAMQYVDDKLIEEAATEKISSRRKQTWIMWGVVAASFVFVAISGWMIKGKNTDQADQVELSQDIADVEYEVAEKMNQITEYELDVQSARCVPENGEYLFGVNIFEARKHYEGSQVTFVLQIDIYENEEPVSNDVLEAELARLQSAGYKVYEAESEGNSEELKRMKMEIVGEFTEEELQNFQINDRYGYYFEFKGGDLE